MRRFREGGSFRWFRPMPGAIVALQSLTRLCSATAPLAAVCFHRRAFSCTDTQSAARTQHPRLSSMRPDHVAALVSMLAMGHAQFCGAVDTTPNRVYYEGGCSKPCEPGGACYMRHGYISLMHDRVPSNCYVYPEGLPTPVLCAVVIVGQNLTK
jgi:hypothetical protein